MRKPRGHVRQRPFGYEIAVPLGRDPITKRYQYRYEYAQTLEEARERLVADVAAGRAPKTEATFGQLLDEVLGLGRCRRLCGGRRGQRQVKATKTHRKRRMALDPGTIELLHEFKEHCRKTALAAGGELDEDGFIFSADGLGTVPWNPDTIGWGCRLMAQSDIRTVRMPAADTRESDDRDVSCTA